MASLAGRVGRADDESNRMFSVFKALADHPGEMTQEVMRVTRPGNVPLMLKQPHHGKPQIERGSLRSYSADGGQAHRPASRSKSSGD